MPAPKKDDERASDKARIYPSTTKTLRALRKKYRLDNPTLIEMGLAKL